MKLINLKMLKPIVISASLILLLFLGIQSNADSVPAKERRSYDPGIELPPGEGEEIISEACTKCHTLQGLPMYKAYFNHDKWLVLVDSMIENGAVLTAEEKELAVNYLTKNFGTE